MGTGHGDRAWGPGMGTGHGDRAWGAGARGGVVDFEPRVAADHGGYQRIRIQPTIYAGFSAAIWA